jgi:hypothetical protein
MRAFVILAVGALCMTVPAVAQNTKATGAEDKTTTTTNPIGSSINAPHSASQGKSRAPDAPIDRGNPTATKNSQALDDPKKGLFSK